MHKLPKMFNFLTAVPRCQRAPCDGCKLCTSRLFPFWKEVSGSARPLSSPGTFRPVRAPPLVHSPPSSPSPPSPQSRQGGLPGPLSFPFILPARPSSPGRSPSASPSPRVCPRPRPSQAPRRPTARQTARRCTPSSCTSSKA